MSWCCCPKDAGSFSVFLNPYRGFDRCATSENRPSWIMLKYQRLSKEKKSIICFYAYAAAECYRSWSHLSPIKPVHILALYPRRPEDHKEIPIPSGPIQIRSFYPGQYPINIRSIYLSRGDKFTSIQHRNTPISSIQIRVCIFSLFRGLFRTTTWPSLYRAQSIFSLRELDQSFVWFGATFLAADLWVLIVSARDQSRDECFLLLFGFSSFFFSFPRCPLQYFPPIET